MLHEESFEDTMEVTLRCTLPDRPGALAALAGAIAEAGADILSVEVVEHADGVALDDLVVLLGNGGLRRVLDGVARLEDVAVVHAAPSRGHPGDAATRLAIGIEAVLTGAMSLERGLTTVAGGLLRATEATLVPDDDTPPDDSCLLVVPAATGQVLVLRRDYRFTRTEHDRALAIARLFTRLGRLEEGAPASRA